MLKIIIMLCSIGLSFYVVCASGDEHKYAHDCGAGLHWDIDNKTTHCHLKYDDDQKNSGNFEHNYNPAHFQDVGPGGSISIRATVSGDVEVNFWADYYLDCYYDEDHDVRVGVLNSHLYTKWNTSYMYWTHYLNLNAALGPSVYVESDTPDSIGDSKCKVTTIIKENTADSDSTDPQPVSYDNKIAILVTDDITRDDRVE